MYNNIGNKIKVLAKFIAFIGIAASLIGGIVLALVLLDGYFTEDMAFIGIIVAIVGPLLSWLSGFFIYGFGELVDQTQQINIKLLSNGNDAALKQKIAKLREWRQKNLITEEEFHEKLNLL